MPSHDDPRLRLASIRARYNLPQHYEPIDAWHKATAKLVRRRLLQAYRRWPLPHGGVVLNAGAGSTAFPLPMDSVVSLDLSDLSISGQPRPIVATVEDLPIRSDAVSAVVCVGSVINYCDAAAAISEFARVMKDGGRLFIEFESSASAELLAKPGFRTQAAVFESFYGARTEVVWGYALAYIRNLLESASLRVNNVVPIHVLSPWVLLATKSPRIAARFSELDDFCLHHTRLERWSSNFILTCTKA